MEIKHQLKINKLIKSRFKESIIKKEQANSKVVKDSIHSESWNSNCCATKSRNKENITQNSTLKFNPNESLNLKVGSGRFNIKKQALKNVNKNQPVKSTRYGTNESGYKANSSFISNKSGSSNYYIMNKNKTKHKVRQKNNSMHLANSDQLNNSNVSSEQNECRNDLDSSVRSIKYSNASPRTLYSAMHKKSDSAVVQNQFQTVDILNTSYDLNSSINEFPIKQIEDIEKVCNSHLKQLIQNTKAEMIEGYLIDTDVEFTTHNDTKSNKGEASKVNAQNKKIRSNNKSSCQFSIPNNLDKNRKRKNNYMNYTVNSSSKEICTSREADLKYLSKKRRDTLAKYENLNPNMYHETSLHNINERTKLDASFTILEKTFINNTNDFDTGSCIDNEKEEKSKANVSQILKSMILNQNKHTKRASCN